MKEPIELTILWSVLFGACLAIRLLAIQTVSRPTVRRFGIVLFLGTILPAINVMLRSSFFMGLGLLVAYASTEAYIYYKTGRPTSNKELGG